VDTPWVTLIWNKYYRDKIPHAVGPCGSFWWKDICKLMPTFRGIAHCQVGDGNSILFWKDLWLDSINSESSPRAFSFTLNEDISVKDFYRLLPCLILSGFHCLLRPWMKSEPYNMILLTYLSLMKKILGHTLGGLSILQVNFKHTALERYKFMMLSNGYGNQNALLALSSSCG
jgi:hypothetical protein